MRTVLFKTKTVIVVMVLLIAVFIIIPKERNAGSKEEQSSITKIDNKFNSMKSIAQPNWWIKPTDTSKAETQKEHSKQATTSSEPVSNFLFLPEMKNWKLQRHKKGIAIATYTFEDIEGSSEHYELAIIRMNSQVTLNDVLSIWQNKVSSPTKQLTKPSLFTSKQKQLFEVYTFKGEQKAISVAVHKNLKYTFFRLSTMQQNNQKNIQQESKKLMQILKNFLTEAYIHN